MPKKIRTHCPHCNKHTEHRVKINKRRPGSSMSRGAKQRARRRGQARGKGNLGRYSKPAVGGFKMTGAKTSKKWDLRLRCSVCKKAHVKRNTFRARRLQLE
ncbi:MAG: 50S ribosomal protein L44e [Candidatus Woesearchaeota archaeon]